jgi:NAD(P)-dependent dehydrogenase (short-subunit alcohol dehydrogenase family)
MQSFFREPFIGNASNKEIFKNGSPQKGLFRVGDKSGFYTGGYGDLGKAIAHSMCDRGVKVVVAGRSLEKGQAAAKHQIAAGKGGKQVHLLSVRSILGIRGRGYSAYCSTKGGLVMLVKQHAMELAPHRINVNGVAPTFVDSQMLDPLRNDPGFLDRAMARNPLGYLADPEDVAGPSIFFCSRAANYITGQILYVDGGITASQ